MNQLANNIALLRKQRGLSQEEFANKVGVSRQTVSQWELGEVVPKVSRIQQICKEFKVSPGELLNTSSDKPLDIKEDINGNYISDQLKVIKNERQLNDEMDSTTLAGVGHISKKKVIKRTILIILAIFFILYAIYSLYKFVVLVYVTTRVQLYKNPDNYYFKVYDYGVNDIDEKVNIWYKEGLYKIVTEYKDNNKTNSRCRWIDLNNNKRYEYDSKTNKIDEYDITDKSIYSSTDYSNGEYMYTYFPDEIRNDDMNYFLLSIKPKFINIKIVKNIFFININGCNMQFDKLTFALKSVSRTTDFDNDEPQKGMRYYNIDLNSVTDADVEIKVDNAK